MRIKNRKKEASLKSRALFCKKRKKARLERKTKENKLKYFLYTKVHKTIDDFKIEILSKRLGYIEFVTRLKHNTCIGNKQLSEEKKQ